jgi:hypothetical protein
MKITLPESSADITLLQYQKYYDLLQRDLDIYQFNQRKIQIFTGIKPNEFKAIKQKDLEDMLIQIDKGLETPAQFVNTFFIDDVEFGFIPNLDKITGAEYFDLSKYGQDVETLHNLMAILFRPIKEKDNIGWFKRLFTKEDNSSNYSIIPYNGTSEWADIMKLTPMNVVNGALFFFLNLSTELVNYTQKYMQVEQVREKSPVTTLKSGDGMQPSMN